MHLKLNSFMTKLYPNLRDYMVLAIRLLLWLTTHKVMQHTQRMLFWYTRWIWSSTNYAWWMVHAQWWMHLPAYDSSCRSFNSSRKAKRSKTCASWMWSLEDRSSAGMSEAKTVLHWLLCMNNPHKAARLSCTEIQCSGSHWDRKSVV